MQAKSKIWTIVFAILYPFITVFGFLFTAILAVFSWFSNALVWVLNKIKKAWPIFLCMNTPIPTYILNNLFGENDENPDVFFVEHNITHGNTTLNIPYRSNYFGIGLCFRDEPRWKRT